MKTKYDQVFFQELLTLILKRRKLNMAQWITDLIPTMVKRRQRLQLGVRPRNQMCNTIGCIAGYAAMVDPSVSYISMSGPIIGRNYWDFNDYSERVFGRNFEVIILEANWSEFIGYNDAFNSLPEYRQAAIALYIYVDRYFGYKLNAPRSIVRLAKKIPLKYKNH